MTAATSDTNQGLFVHWRAMVGACERVLGDREEAEDCASEALLAALRDGGLDGIQNLEAWLVRIAKRRAYDAVRRDVRGRTRAKRLAARANEHVADLTESILDQAEARWLAQAAEQILPQATAAVLASVADGYTVGEAADRLGMTKRAAESHLHRARAALRAAWTATLAVLGWMAAGFRRVAPSAPAAALAAVVGLLAGPWPPHEGGAVEPPRLAPVTTTLALIVPAAERAGSASERAAPLVKAPRRTAPDLAAARAGGRRVVQRVETPGAGAVNVDAEDRPSPGDPVGAVLWCLDNLQVSQEHVGC